MRGMKMIRTRLFCTASAALALSATPAFAQGEYESTNNEENNVIIVTGTRFETPIDQVGRSVSVITAEDFDIRQQRFLYDALNAAPGVQVIRSGSFGALTSVSLRGLPSDQTLVIQDGVVLNNPGSFGNGFNFANFDTVDIERVEVLRGAQSTLYGSDAIAGVVNIVTKDGRDGFGGEAFVEGGSFGSFRGAASLMGGGEVASGRITVSGVTTDGFSTADEANGNTEKDGYNSFVVSSKVRLAPSDDFTFDAIIRYQDSENEFDGFDFVTGAADADEVGQTEELTVAGFATHTFFDERATNRFSVTYRLNDQLNLSDGVASFDSRGSRISYEYQGEVKPADWVSVIAGAEYDKQTSEVTIGFGGNQEIETTSGFGLVQLHPLSFVTLNAGVRHDASPDFGGETTFSVSGAVEILETGAIIRGSFAEGFRAPTAGEFSFNPDLFPEVSNGWDVGVEQPFLDGGARLSITYFDQHVDDLIAFDLAAFTFVNIQEYSSKGVEIAFDAEVNDRLSVNAAYTYTDALNLSTEIAAGNQPKHRINVEFAARPTDRLTLSAAVAYNGTEQDGAQTLDDYVLVGVRGAYAMTEHIELFARVENLTDADYQDNFGFGTAPLSVYGGIRTRF